jgi:hypothetical protein
MKIIRYKPLKHKLIALLSLFLILIFWNACTVTQPVKLDVLQPAKINISTDIQNVALVYQKTDNFKSFNQSGEKTQLISDTAVAYNMLSGLYNQLSNTPKFNVLDSIIILPSTFIGNWNYLRNMSDSFGVDALVVIDKIAWSADKPTTVYYNSYTGQYDATLVVRMEVSWKLFVPEKQMFVDSFIARDTLMWERSAWYAVDAFAAIPSVNQVMPDAAFELGKQYGKRISPYWVENQRFYYQTPGREMKKATALANNNDWIGAATIWRPIAEFVENKKTASYASFNMAIASEMCDQLEAALEWSAKSYILYPNINTKQYIKILERRKLVRDSVLLQLP